MRLFRRQHRALLSRANEPPRHGAGMLTARLGLATIDVVRPLPFTVLPRPTLSDLMSEALRRREDSASTERLEPPETETFTKPD